MHMSAYLSGKGLRSSDQVHELALYLWETGERPRGIVQVVHGMRDHMGRYADFARYLSRHGFIVCGHDQLGHGRTAGVRGDYGFFAREHGARILVQDCSRVTRWVTSAFPELPVFLLGHSMGSLIGRIYILHHANRLAGFLCMGTSGERAYMPLVRAMSGISGGISSLGARSRLTDHLLRLSNGRRLRRGESEMAWLSRDSAAVEDYLADAHTRPHFTRSAYNDLFELQLAACSKGWAGRVDPGLPILLLSGEEDPVGDFGRGVVQTYDRLKLAGALDVRCKLYEGARHDLLNELNREEVCFDILEWLGSHLPDPLGDRLFL
jgi:alpha-beta hydrolase superfamily lysophospholipase